ncbi:hypothetical protein ACUR5C_15795 [Aliikangiella sp. IMCC44653]
MLARVFWAGLMWCCLSGCTADKAEPLDLQKHINSGEADLHLKPNQELIINPSAYIKSPLRVNLGRKSRESAKFNFFSNQVQKSIEFTQAGKYSLTVSSQPAVGQAPNTLSLPVVVIVN